MVRRHAAMTLVVLLVSAIPAAAQPAPLWGELSLLGGAAAARRVFRLGDPDGRLAAGVLVDFVRRHSSVANWDGAAARMRQYQSALSLVRDAAQGAPGGIRVPVSNAARDQSNRDLPLASALGLERVTGRNGVSFVPGLTRDAQERAAWMRAVGIDTDTVAARWGAGESVSFVVPTSRVPLPLPAYWASHSRGGPSIDAVLRDRRSALLYVALIALDDETLRFLADHPALLDRLDEDAVAALAAFASSIRIRDTAVVLPGGPAAWPTWQSIVGPAPDDPQAFLPALLSADHGALVRFVDALAKAPASTQRVLSAAFASAPQTLLAVHRAFRDACRPLALRVRPFDRPVSDPALALALVDLDGPGLPGPPWIPRVLERAVDGQRWPATPAPVSEIRPDAQMAWLAGWLFAEPGRAVERARLLRRIRRIEALDSASPADVEIALRTAVDLPALAQTLDRLGVRDAALAAEVGRAAYQLTHVGPRKAAEPVVNRWQAALAILEQAVRLGRLPRPASQRLLRTLAKAATLPPAETANAVAVWVTDHLLPALDPDIEPAPLTAGRLADALRPSLALRTRVQWDGLDYARDPALKAHADAAALLGARPPTAQLDVRTMAVAQGTAADAESLRASIRESRRASPVAERLSRQLAAAARAMRRRGAVGRPRSERLPPEVDELVRQGVDLALQPVAYALAMSPLHHAAGLQSEAWTYHRIAPSDAGEDWWRTAWSRAITTIRPGGGRALTGSWLVLDLALGEAMVPRRFDQGGDLPDPVREALFLEVSVRTQAADDDGSTRQWVEALARGRAWVAAAAARPVPDASRLDQMGTGSTRANLVRWSLAHDPTDLAKSLTMIEVARLGQSEPLGSPTVAVMLDACACVRPVAMAADDWRGQWARGLTVALASDVHLRVAELLAGAHLPLLLANDVLPLVAADWIARIEPYATDDWEALTLWPRRLTAADLDGYVLQLMADGVLVPWEEPSR